MAGDTYLTIVGNLIADPELRYTNSGAPVANFTVASTPRTFDRETREWKDSETLFMRCSVWRDYAENVAESLTKGARVIVYGRIVQRNWESQQGERRSSVEMQVEEVGPALRFATAKVERAQRGSSSFAGGQNQFGGANAGGGGGFNAAPAGGSQQDPWGTQGSTFDDDPPF
ncbi:MAG: single-stranded DNA-binding protein [Bowdeniella nasicola]|nr:single-stranded DNA-binding protein [Bowdeniella nasicola]